MTCGGGLSLPTTLSVDFQHRARWQRENSNPTPSAANTIHCISISSDDELSYICIQTIRYFDQDGEAETPLLW
jgi:hypothetical protein